MTKDEALKLALEALESKYIVNCGAWRVQQDKAITAIKEALAQPEQEPVAWIYKGEKSFDGNKYSDEYELTASKQVALWKDKNAKPLYTTPPQRTWVGLTEKDICEAAVKSQDGISPRDDTLRFAIAIEAKLKEKNT